MDIDTVLFYLFWLPGFLMEIRVASKKYASSSKDHGTLRLIWLVVVSSITLTMLGIRWGYGMKIIHNSWIKFTTLVPISSVLCMFGSYLRRQSIEQLGQWFTISICTNEKQELIDSGWYSRMRHPSYTGALICLLGITLILNNWLGLIGIFLPICCVFRYRIYIEENELEKHFGSKYRNYREKVPRMIIPRIF